MLNRIIYYFLDNKLITLIVALGLVLWGIRSAPFNWETGILSSDAVPVDAIPDIGENQQIVFTEWVGRSPQDIEDQITYPLTTSLLGLPGVKSIRSSSVLGFSSIYVIFNDNIDFYWSRTRILEKLNSLPSGMLPKDVSPRLGPDATALGQVFWYTLEGRDENNQPTGGWDLDEIRSQQDFFVKYALDAVEDVAEVASIGGFVKEYQIDLNPDALKEYGVSLENVIKAVKNSNRDVGAKTIEINKAEYLVRGLGYLKSVEDINQAVVKIQENTPITIKDVAKVKIGPAGRRGLLDKDGAEVVGGVVIARYKSNPLEVINKVKAKIKQISPGLPTRILPNGVESKLTIVPFYDRSELIEETLDTLNEALLLEVLITILVVIVMILNLRASIIISSLLPIAILMVFIAMRLFGVDANIVALSGIAIAIGTMVDLGIIMSENIIKHLKNRVQTDSIKNVIYKASSEVSSAIITAVATTIVSFIPVFAMQDAEGKLFRPLAYTKTFALLAALVVALIILPTVANWVFAAKTKRVSTARYLYAVLAVFGIVLLINSFLWAGITLLLYALAWFLKVFLPKKRRIVTNLPLIVTIVSVVWLLAKYWMPLGLNYSIWANFFFVALVVSLILGAFALIEKYYTHILHWCLENKKTFLALPLIIILLGLNIWIGFDKVFGFLNAGSKRVGLNIEETTFWDKATTTFPGMSKEFMPSLDEGSFLLMPTSMPHAGMEQNKETVQKLDMLTSSIPEVDITVGKMGRAETALDPAPISMYENIINYKSEYMQDDDGNKLRFKVDNDHRFVFKNDQVLTQSEALAIGIQQSDLILDEDGRYFRNWREKIRTPDDIWNEIVRVTKLPGVTSAPKLQPIETRLVMLQTGMRAPMGIKVFGPDLSTIEEFGLELESILKEVPTVKKEAVFADRIVGKPYLHLKPDRAKISRYGLNIEDIQRAIETTIGGMQITSTVEGRERYPVRVRYPRELRDDPMALTNIYVTTPLGIQIPMGEIMEVEYLRGPQMIKSENTFLMGYVLFDKNEGFSEIDVVDRAKQAIEGKIERGELVVPAGVSYKFSGNYENQVRAEKRLSLIVPLVLIIIFLILYFQFKSVSTSLMVFAGIVMAFSGAFLMLEVYNQEWMLNFSVFDINVRELFQMHPVNLSVAVWVGFIALFGIATDDGVLIATYLDQGLKEKKPKTREEIRNTVVYAGQRRIKPAIMTSATTIIALLPVLTSTGRGSDIMIPMAIPAFGGMVIASITYFIVPVLYSWREERKTKNTLRP
jgi:Cu(I)/Ag(I) efflux system membrane protein CusA/SilA